MANFSRHEIKPKTFDLLAWDWPVQVVDYVGVFVFPHHQDLIDDQLFLGLLLQVHLLDSHLRKQTRNLQVRTNVSLMA